MDEPYIDPTRNLMLDIYEMVFLMHFYTEKYRIGLLYDHQAVYPISDVAFWSFFFIDLKLLWLFSDQRNDALRCIKSATRGDFIFEYFNGVSSSYSEYKSIR